MAKRRLNKKVALVGLVIFVVVALGVIWAILRLGRDPQPFIDDGNAALLAKDYRKAESSFRSAYARAKNDALREEILFKLLDMFIETNQWSYVPSYWDEAIRINPDNAKARYGLLKYFYTWADSGSRGAWQQVREHASEFLDVAEVAGLLDEETEQWESFETSIKPTKGQRLGPYLYLLRGRATFEMTRLGMVTNKEKSLNQAVEDLEKARQLDKKNLDAYLYLARAAISRWEIFGSSDNIEERDKATDKALALIEESIQISPNEPRAHINLLTLKLSIAQRSGETPVRERIELLEPEYLALTEKFPSSDEVFASLSGFYSIYSVYSGHQLSLENNDKSIEAIEKAIELNREKASYAINAADLYYRKFSIYGQKPAINKAIKAAKDALDLPDAQDIEGPQSYANRVNRYLLYSFLAHCYIEQVLEPSDAQIESQREAWLSDAEQAVHEVEQILGMGEDPKVMRWRGMLELAKGNRNNAVRHLYAAYERLKAVKPTAPPWPRDVEFARLSYTLANIFQDTSEVGAATEFLASALYSGIAEIKPGVRLDYVEALLKLNVWTVALGNINAYESNYSPNERSEILRIKTYIGANQFDEVARALAKRPDPDDPETIKLSLALAQARIAQIQIAIAKQTRGKTALDLKDKRSGFEINVGSEASLQVLRAELKQHKELREKLVEKLLPIDPNSVGRPALINVCENYVRQDRIDDAKNLADRYLRYFPDSTTVLIYKQMLSELDPQKISMQRGKEIEEQVLLKISDPLRRAVKLGIFYSKAGKPEKSVAEFKKALQAGVATKGTASEKEMTDLRRIAASYFFDIVLQQKDWEQAEQIIETARRENLDNCSGDVFVARYAVAKKEFKDALVKLNDCLKQRPIFSRAYMLRSRVNSALGDEKAAVDDARKAASLNPLDGSIAKGLAEVLYRDYQKLGSRTSPDQTLETKIALERAVALNRNDVRLLSRYAEFINPKDPLKALAILQDIQRAAPSLGNALRLGVLATESASTEMNAARKKALFDIAESAYKWAMNINPGDPNVLYGYGKHLRARGRNEEAELLLKGSEDQGLLWDFYFQQGRYTDAKKVLEQLYKGGGAKDISVLRGLFFVAEKTNDKEGVKKYSEEILLLDDNIEYHLLQIQTFLRVGLVREAEYKLQAVQEKYPNESRTLLLEAWLAMRQGQLEKALQLVNRSFQSDRKSAAAWKLRGEINFLSANYDQAISDLRESKALSSTPSTQLSLAKTYIQAGRYDDAMTELKNTLDAPDAPSQARSLLEKLYLQYGRKAPLRRLYDDTLKKFPGSVHWLNRVGAFAVSTGEYIKAEELYLTAYEIKQREYLGRNSNEWVKDVQYVTAFDGYLRALVLGAGTPGTAGWHPQKLDSVFELCERYLDTSLSPIAYLRMAEAKLKLDDEETATDYFRKAVDNTGTNELLASEVLLRMFLMLGSDEVSKYCRQKLETNPNSLAANYTMFNVAKINSQYDEALFYIVKCIQLTDPCSPGRLDYTAKKAEMLTIAYDKTSDNNFLEMAITDYESLLAKMPNNISVLNNLAFMLAENNERLPQALEYAKKALDIKPNEPSFLDTYGYLLYKNGKHSEAAEAFSAAIQQYDQNGIVIPPEVYEHLGMVREKLGASGEALAAYKQAMEVGSIGLSAKRKERLQKAIERLSP